VTKIISLTLENLATPKARAKQEHFFNKSASDALVSSQTWWLLYGASKLVLVTAYFTRWLNGLTETPWKIVVILLLDWAAQFQCLGLYNRPLSICPWKRLLNVLAVKSCWKLMTVFHWLLGIQKDFRSEPWPHLIHLLNIIATIICYIKLYNIK